MSDIEFEEEIKQVQHSLNDCISRTDKINKQKRKYIAYLKKAEQLRRKVKIIRRKRCLFYKKVNIVKHYL